MKHRLTRQELLQRAAFGAALASVPGFAAACGGSSSSSGGSGGTQKLADTLRFSNWPLYIDVDPKTKQPGTLAAFTKKTGVKVDYTEDINSNSEYFGKIQGPLSRGQSINRDIIVLTDNERYLALMIDKGWVEPLDKDVIVNITNLVDVQKHPGFDPDRKYTLPVAVGHDRHRLQREADEADPLDRPAARGQEPQGQGHGPERLRGHARPRHARERRRPEQGHRRDLQECARPREGGVGLRADPPVHRQRLRGPAQQGRPAWRASRGPGTSSSSRPTTRT